MFTQLNCKSNDIRMVPLDDQAHQQVTNRSLDNSMYWIIKWPVGVLDRPKEPFYYQLSMPNNFHKSNYIPDIKSKGRWTISHAWSLSNVQRFQEGTSVLRLASYLVRQSVRGRTIYNLRRSKMSDTCFQEFYHMLLGISLFESVCSSASAYLSQCAPRHQPIWAHWLP